MVTSQQHGHNTEAWSRYRSMVTEQECSHGTETWTLHRRGDTAQGSGPVVVLQVAGGVSSGRCRNKKPGTGPKRVKNTINQMA